MTVRVRSVASAFPETFCSQAELLAAFRDAWSREHFNEDRLERLHRNVLVGGRHLALPLDAYLDLDFTAANDAWIRVATELGARAVQAALERAERRPDDVRALVTTTVTGVATPSLDARLVAPLGLPSDVRRVPLFGLGCVAGAAGIARATDLLRGLGDGVAVLLSVELCSLTLQREDLSIPNLIASGLFGDGAAAVVLESGDGTGPEVIASRSVFYPETEHVMGWKVGSDGFRIVLSAEVPLMVERHVGGDVDRFLADHGLGRGDVDRWIAHPGGPKVLRALETTLGLAADALEPTWRSLRDVGNLSSTSILLVLGEVLTDPPPPGSRALMIAMGPGFCSELVLLQW